jgi:hypothetical protein
MRPTWLRKCVESILDTCGLGDDVQILARTDDDDPKQRKMAIDLLGEENVLTGPRMRGYWSINHFYTEMALKASAPWIWLMNDECTIRGDWVDDLSKIPVTGFVVQPESYQVGQSMYRKVHDTTCPIVPNYYWLLCDQPGVPYSTDTDTYTMLNKQLGWQTVYLPRLHLAHYRFTDQEYKEHHGE